MARQGLLRFVLLVALLGLCASPEAGRVRAADSEWESTSVRQLVSRVAVAGDVVYALVPPDGETPSALWRGEGEGTDWRTVTLPTARLTDLAAHPSDPRVVYVAGTGGVYRSTDGGATWSNVLSGGDRGNGLRVVVSPADPTLLYATTGIDSDGTIWRSLDGGESWERLRSLQGSLCGWSFPLIAPDPQVRERVYLSYACMAGRTTFATLRVSDDLWSTDGRVILQPTPRPGELLTNLYPQGVWFTPDGRQGLVVANRDARLGGSVLLRTQDGGTSWEGLLEYPSHSGSQIYPEVDVILDGLVMDTRGRIMVGRGRSGHGVLGSTDGGATWYPVGGQPLGRVQTLAYAPGTDVLYAATDRGLWRLAGPELAPPELMGPRAGPWSVTLAPVLGSGPGETRSDLEPLDIPPDADPLSLRLDHPTALAPAPEGSLLVVDSNYLLTRLRPDGSVERVPVDASFAPGAFRNVTGLAASADGGLVYSVRDGTVQAITPGGETVHLAGRGFGPSDSPDDAAAQDVRLVLPAGVLVDDASGTVYVADSGNHVVRRIDPDGLIHTVAGSGRPGWSGDGLPATETDLDEPWALALDLDRHLLIADRAGQRVVRLEADGTLSTVAGSGLQGYAGDSGPAPAARFAFPSGLAVDDLGRVYVADYLNHAVRVVDFDGLVWTLAPPEDTSLTPAALDRPIALAWTPSGLFVADYTQARVLRLSPQPPVLESGTPAA